MHDHDEILVQPERTLESWDCTAWLEQNTGYMARRLEDAALGAAGSKIVATLSRVTRGV